MVKAMSTMVIAAATVTVIKRKALQDDAYNKMESIIKMCSLLFLWLLFRVSLQCPIIEDALLCVYLCYVFSAITIINGKLRL